MSGPLSVPAAIAAFYVPNEVAKAILAVTALACAVFSSYWVWQRERQAVLDAGDEIRGLKERLDTTKPIVTAWIDALLSHSKPDYPNSSGVLLTVSVRNVGFPTVLEGWKVNVKWPNGTLVEGRRQFIPERLTMEGPRGTGVYYGRDAIYNKTIEKPVWSYTPTRSGPLT